MQFPVYERARKRLIAVELDLFVGPDYLVTLPSHDLPPVQALFERFSEREDLRHQVFSKGPGYLLYRIVDACVDASFPMLRKMGLKLDQLEDDIFEERRTSEIVRDINDLKQEIISFRRIVRPQRAVLGDLEKTKQRYLAEDMEIYFDDISDAAERIWDILDNYKEVIDSLESTNESVLTHRLNDSIRILTAFSVMLLPLTLIASVYGMNVHLPFEDAGPRGLLAAHRGHGRGAAADGRLLPTSRLAVSAAIVRSARLPACRRRAWPSRSRRPGRAPPPRASGPRRLRPARPRASPVPPGSCGC